LRLQTSRLLQLDAHRVVHLAATCGLADEMEERLLKAYFTDGISIGKREELVRLATEVGLNAGACREMLQSDRFIAEVRADQNRAHALGFRGVPAYVVDNKYGIPGAESAESILATLRRAWSEKAARGPQEERRPTADVCEGDACAVAFDAAR
jgi:predicted DsbA family dithiol-disulfide isomerase